jgi:Putative peptidoglycan binding domain
MEDCMKSSDIAKSITAFAIVAAVAGCSTWHTMDKTEGTALGGAGGAVAGAVVAGPVGAVVGGVGGAYAGHEVAGKDQPGRSSTESSSMTSSRYDPATVRSVQQALNDRGYDAGPVDGQWGPNTEDAVRQFQQASGLPRTGELEGSTLAALGVAPAR